MAYLEFLKDVDARTEAETEAYIDNFVFGRDQVRKKSITRTLARSIQDVEGLVLGVQHSIKLSFHFWAA